MYYDTKRCQHYHDDRHNGVDVLDPFIEQIVIEVIVIEVSATSAVNCHETQFKSTAVQQERCHKYNQSLNELPIFTFQ